MNDNNEKVQQLMEKRERLTNDLNKEVETLKQLLENNIMYIDIETITNNILELKRQINIITSDINIYSET